MLYTRHKITIGIVAGEISGDLLGAGLIQKLQQHLSNVQFYGVAGPKMKLTGMNVWYSMEELTTMGIVEIITHLPRILKIRRNLMKKFSILKPDVFIGIDLPDFNITLEKYLKNQGICTIHYVSPTVWAWRKKRIFEIARATNDILVLLPFEKKIYDQHNIPCKFIGHPLANIIPLTLDKITARQILGISNKALCLALLPGSRDNEVKRLIKDFITSAELLNQQFPGIEVLIPIAHEKLNKYFKNIPSQSIKFHILKKQSILAMTAADAALLASGTATLECMLAKCPMVVAYRIHPLSFILIKTFIKTQWISLPNLLAKDNLIKEFIQTKCRPKNLVNAIIPLLADAEQRLKLQNTFLELHKKIKLDANTQAAHAVIKLINHSLKNK